MPESTLPDTPTPTPPPTPTPAPDPPPTTPSAVIYGCDGQPAARPDSFILLCGDGGERLEGMTWSGWGGSTATATGQVWRKSCVPDCATGNVLPYPATVTVSGLNGGSYGSMRVDAPDSPTPAEEFTLDSSGPRVVQNG
ncbi:MULTISPECIES: hypothetical protein [Kitasatospora]|uniref:hypothetical protein n=1 Tax=Kitasatospora TaxID=2063 RepID=UPI0031DCA2F6